MSSWVRACLLATTLLATLPVSGKDPANPYAGRDNELGREATPQQ